MGTKRKKPGLLKRPNTIVENKHNPRSLKPKQARSLIRRFHVLQKNRHSIFQRLNNTLNLSKESELNNDNYKEILKTNFSKMFIKYEDTYRLFKVPAKSSNSELLKLDSQSNTIMLITKLAEIDSEEDKRGGIEVYQSASTQGQNSKRGGDSLKKLVEWLKDEHYHYHNNLQDKLHALEIGCLSPLNRISTSGIFREVTKIDLNSQSHSILQQDFMERPLPESENEKFNLISCSLVLNFVPSPKERGQMLKRITCFLKTPSTNNLSSLFLVLPLPCIENSRYFNNDILSNIMSMLGFTQVCYYAANKVAYWLFDWNGKINNREQIKKREIASGSNKNNFCITLD